MGFRFRSSFKIAPGVRLNLSKSGGSFTLGRRGASVNIGARPRVTVGLPGTGLSYTQPIGAASDSAAEAQPEVERAGGWFLLLVMGALAIGIALLVS